MSEPWNSTRPKRAYLAAGLVLLLSLAAYFNSFQAQFHFDDYHQIVSNPAVRSLANLPRFFHDPDMGSFYTETKGYRPVTYASFALNYALSGYDVFGFHLFNFLLHVMNALLVYLIAVRVLKESRREWAVPAALAAALVFAVHPIQTGAVTYISGRAVLLAAFFYLLAFYSFLRFRSEEGGARHMWAAASPLFFLMALLSKEMAVSLIAVFIAYDLLLKRRGRAGVMKAAEVWLFYLPFVAILVGYLLARKTILGYASTPVPDYGVVRYLMSELKSLLLYGRLMIFPVNQNADWYLPLARYMDLSMVLAAAALALAVYMLYRARRALPHATFFGAWFFLTLAPESSLVPINDIAVEYRLYLPSVGFIAILTALAAEVVGSSTARKWLAAVVIVMLTLLTFSRNAVWATEHSLWADVARKSPHSGRAFHNLGLALIREGDHAGAARELGKSLEVEPGYAQAFSVHTNLGLCLLKSGDPEGAVREFEQAVSENPRHLDAYGYMGTAYYEMGLYAESVAAFHRAISLNPGFADAHSNLANSYAMLRRYGDALREAKEAYRLDPKDFGIGYNLAVAYHNSGMHGEAYEHAKIALSLAGNEEERKGAEALLAALRPK